MRKIAKIILRKSVYLTHILRTIGKRLRITILAPLSSVSTFALKKAMSTPSIYPRIIADYQNHLRSGSLPRLNFSSFCRLYNIDVNTVLQWMHWRGLTVSVLRYEVMLETCDSHPPVVPSSASSQKGKYLPELSDTNNKGYLPLRGINVTFSDGTIVTIRQATSAGLSRFIESYNQLCDKNHVQPQ